MDFPYYVGKNPYYEKNPSQSARVQNAVLGCNLKNDRMISVHFQGRSFNITVIQIHAPTSNTEEAEVERFYEDLQDLLELTPNKDAFFIIEDWTAKVGNQEITGLTGNSDLEIQNEAGQRLTEFCQENTQVVETPSFNNTRDDSTHGHHQMVDTKIRLIVFFAAEHEEALYSQQNQGLELTVDQITSSLMQNSSLN